MELMLPYVVKVNLQRWSAVVTTAKETPAVKLMVCMDSRPDVRVAGDHSLLCGSANSWFTTYCVFRFDVDSHKIEKIIDFSSEPGDWHIYGCSLGIHPQTDELYASVFHQFQTDGATMAHDI